VNQRLPYESSSGAGGSATRRRAERVEHLGQHQVAVRLARVAAGVGRPSDTRWPRHGFVGHRRATNQWLGRQERR
jgi:hypothetical protein